MNYKAKKKFGQNFLKNDALIGQIVQAIPKTGSQIVEIGVGLGDLTYELLKFHSLVAYEVDADLCSLLSGEGLHNLTLICRDVLEMKDKEGWLHPKPYFLVSNLPYYIATHIVLRVIRDPQCEGFVVMTQKEVAEKFCAQEGMRDFCALSVLLQSVGRAEWLFEVPSDAFEPAPKVTSAVFRLIKDRHFADFEKLEALLKCAFSAPRKKLFSNLAHFYGRGLVARAFEDLDIDTSVRPHELSTSLYHQAMNLLREG